MPDDILQARRLLAYLGWTYGMPTTRGNSAGWSDMVPISSTRPLREVATGEALEKARAYGLDLDAPDRGRLKVTAPTDSSYFRGMPPLVWADLQVQHLDPHMIVDWAGDLPPMPEAEPLARVRENAAERKRLLNLRVLLIQEARGRRPAEAIAEAAGISKQGIYKVYRQSPEPGVVPEGDVLDLISSTVAGIADAEEQRAVVMREAREAGASLEAVAHFGGCTPRTVASVTGPTTGGA